MTHQITEQGDDTHNPDEGGENVVSDETLVVSQDVEVAVLTLVTPIQTVRRPITNVLPRYVPAGRNWDEMRRFVFNCPRRKD